MLDSLSRAQKFALSALLEVQPPATVGEFVGETDEGDYVTSYRFATTLPGYPGWVWTVTVADLPDEHPTVVESELLPAEGALLAPDWVPWSERMEEYRAAQAALGETEGDEDPDAEDDDDLDDELDDDDDDDDDEDDLLGSDNLHGGDLDGVDIDELEDPDASDDYDNLTPEAEAVAEVLEADTAVPEPVEGPPTKKPTRSRRASKPAGE